MSWSGLEFWLPPELKSFLQTKGFQYSRLRYSGEETDDEDYEQ